MNTVLDFTRLKELVIATKLFKSFRAFDTVTFKTYRLDLIRFPLFTFIALRFICRKHCIIVDDYGKTRAVTFSLLFATSVLFIADALLFPFSFLATYFRFIRLKKACLRKEHYPLRNELPPLYLRSDMYFGIKAGGSLSHIAGVVHSLVKIYGDITFISSDAIISVDKNIHQHIVFPLNRFMHFKNFHELYYNRTLSAEIFRILDRKRVSFIYQRYSLNNFTGIEASLMYKVPFVLEYNGSEVWVREKWGNDLNYKKLSTSIELLNLQYADVIVVVSNALKNELRMRGIDSAKILVNPNGVDPDRHSPQVDGTSVRSTFHMNDKVVIGFLGTFGKWHGADILVQAYALLLQKHPHLKDQTMLFLIGDGYTMNRVRELIAVNNLSENCCLPGIVPQRESQHYLAACDILVSPTLPNPDGTEFFGSPTKLFEYMAMGKAIISSDLAQMGEILEHNTTALLTKAGDINALSEGLRTLIKNHELRVLLGRNARNEVLKKYTWDIHTRKIVDKLTETMRE